jgi:hypothetical protein
MNLELHKEDGITYRDLLEYLKSLDDENLDATVTVFDDELLEYYPILTVTKHNDSDVVNGGQICLTIPSCKLLESIGK